MELGVYHLVFLFIAAVLTAIVNAVAAVGGGMTLFAIMISMLSYAIVIPVHAVIQVWSSLSRVWIFRSHINYRIIGKFLVTYIPSAVLGTIFWLTLIKLEQIQPYLKIAIAIYLIMFLGNWSFKIRTNDKTKLMLYAGGWSGVVAFTAGSPAPVMAPLFIKADLYKEEFIGSWALSGVIIHLSKFPLFYFIWDEISEEHFWLIILLGVGVVMGTYIGKAILGRVNESFFRKLLTGVLLFLAAKLIIWDGIRVLAF